MGMGYLIKIDFGNNNPYLIADIGTYINKEGASVTWANKDEAIAVFKRYYDSVPYEESILLKDRYGKRMLFNKRDIVSIDLDYDLRLQHRKQRVDYDDSRTDVCRTEN